MYIRTKDGVYEVEWNSCVEMWCDVKTYKGFILDSMISKVDYKLSENLEELCDEFCYIKNGVVSQYLTISFKYKRDDEFCALRNKLTANAIVEISKGISKYELENGELKFAIWNDKGLIYVAKMNDNGVLELI